MNFKEQGESKLSLQTAAYSTDNESFITASSEIIEDYKNITTNNDNDMLYDSRGTKGVFESNIDNISTHKDQNDKIISDPNISSSKNGIFLKNNETARYSYNATPKINQNEEYIVSSSNTSNIDQVLISPTLKRDLTLTRHSQTSLLNNESSNIVDDHIKESDMNILLKKKKNRATSSYYEPMDTSKFNNESFLNNPIPNLEYRKTYALTNEYNPVNTIDSEIIDDHFEKSLNAKLEEYNEADTTADQNTTADSISVEKIDQAKENWRQSMLMSESIFNNQNVILAKESQKKASIILNSTKKIPAYRKSNSLITEADEEEANSASDDSNSVIQNTELDLKKEDFNHLFILSTKNFDKETLEEEEDKNVCLSFDSDELAFVHAVEESGWGEVTLIKTLERGWVPLNYFTDCIKPLEIFLPTKKEDGKSNDKIVELRATILSRQYLAPLFQAAGKFLVNPINDVNNVGKNELDIESINTIQKAIKQLLVSTGCISRSNEIVAKKLLVKKTRKRLLADWYSISLKADKYKGSDDINKIVILKKMIFQLLRRAYLFYNIWSIEVQTFENEKRLLSFKKKNIEMTQNSRASEISSGSSAGLNLPVNTIYLISPPMAQQRLNEVNSFIFQYIGIILGRMDLIENNSAGYEVLEYIIRQVILLLRELLYISKSCSLYINEKYNNQYENNLDSNLDPLLALVSDLVSTIKKFINKMFERLNNDENFLFDASKVIVDDQDAYKPTPEAMQIIKIVSKMTAYITNCIVSCNNYLRIIGDYQLGDDKKYPDFAANSITVNDFIKICSKSLLDQIKQMEWKIVQDKLTINKSLARYSIIQTGLLGDKNLMLNNNGVDYLNDLFEEEEEEDNENKNKNTNFLKDKLLQKFTIQETSDAKVEKAAVEHELNKINDRLLMFKELQFDEIVEQLTSGTLRSIVCYLTDEIIYQKHNFNNASSLSKNDNLLISTFFMNFKLFTDSKTLISLLITRFDENEVSRKFEKRDYDASIFTNWQSQLRHRKRLVLKLLRTWLESYWDYKADYFCLPILINFLNETCNKYLPLETKNLMTIVSKLILVSSNEHSGKFGQLIPKSLRNTKINSMSLRFSQDLSLTNQEIEQKDAAIVEEYDLMNKENQDSLPVPISGLGSANLLTPKEFVSVKNSVNFYKKSLHLQSDTTQLSSIVEIWIENIKNNTLVERNLNEMFCDLTSMEIAKQLTLIEAYFFAKIDSDEFLNIDLNDASKNSTGIKCLVEFTNQLSNYVIESLVSGETTVKILKRFESWLKIALSCFYYKNFNSLACIITSLQNHNISRMKFIWNNLKGKNLELFTKLTNIMDPTSNYKNYRNKLKIFTRTLKKNYDTDNMFPINPDGNNTVVIPFLNLFLQDLIMVNELNTATTSLNPNKKVILISKFYKVTHILEEIQELQFFIVDNLEPLFSKKAITLSPLDNSNSNKEFITNIPVLQEFIFFEITAVNHMYLQDPDRAYELLNR
ncbi:hypothetical protein QEN19_002882 [Hanseniaspora menglaensis]